MADETTTSLNQGLGKWLQITSAGLIETWNGTQKSLMARVTHSANQTIPTGTQTALNFDTELYDYGSLHDTATNNTRITVSSAGVYRVGAIVSFAANGTGVRAIYIRVNGDANIRPGSAQIPAAGSSNTIVNVSTEIELAANDYVECLVVQTSGGDLSVDSNTTGLRSPIFTLSRVF